MDVEKLFSLKGRVALITGGSRGIGKMIARGFLASGAKVYITARKAAQCDATAAELQAQGYDCVSIPIDVSTVEGCKRLAEELAKREDKLDILVNNAGATWGAPAEDHPVEAWDKVMDLNVRAVFLISQAVGKRCMIPRGAGRIVNVASIAGLSGNGPAMTTLAYNTSKGAVINFTRALAGEWGRHGITVNALAPGFFPSRMTRGTLARLGEDALAEKAPLRRLGDDDDLKGAAVLFASAAGKHITGQILAVDGGVSAVHGG